MSRTARRTGGLHDAADHDGDIRPVPVTTPTVMAPVNVSVMTIMVRQLARGVDCTLKRSAAPLRDRTACRARRAVSLGSPPSATSPSLTPSASLTLVPDTAVSASASPVRASPVTGVRTPPCTSIRASADAAAVASGSVLRTTAVSTVSSPRHSIAVAAPSRVPHPRRFPFAHTPSLSFLTACRGFGFHTPRIDDAGCAIGAFGVQLSAQPSPSAATVLLDRAYAASTYADILPLAMHGYACPTPIHGRYTLVAAENADRYTTDMRP